LTARGVVAVPRASRSGGDTIWGGGEEEDSPKEVLHSGAQSAGVGTGERP
jgi:hypothetical protein